MARKKLNPEQKEEILLAGFRKEMSVSEICLRYGVSDVMYYKWEKTFLESGLNGLKSNDNVTNGEAVLQRENEDL